MSIYQQGICDISWDNRKLINVHIVDIINQSDTFTLCCVSWLYNPNVLFAVMLFQLLVVLIELSEFIGKNVSIWYEVKVLLTILLLHPNNIEAKSIFSSNLITLREVIDFLILVEPFIEVALAAGRTPKHVPLVWLCQSKTCCL